MNEHETSESAQVDPRAFRRVMGGFATGVAIVTTKTDDGERHGMTVNSLTSVSLDPTLLLVCLTEDSRTAEAVLSRGWFVVNILEARQEILSDRFARAGVDHFAGVEITDHREHDLPVIPGGMGHVVCRVADTFPGGDHVIVLGEVQACEERPTTSPLVFFRGQYDTLTGDGREAYWEWYG